MRFQNLGLVNSHGLLVVIANVDNVDGVSLRVFVDAINWDVCIRFVIWPLVNGVTVVCMPSTWIDGNVDVDVAISCDGISGIVVIIFVDLTVTDSIVVSFVVGDDAIADAILLLSPLTVPSIDGITPFVLLYRVNDNDDNDASTCFIFSLLGIVSDPTNSFIVPL